MESRASESRKPQPALSARAATTLQRLETLWDFPGLAATTTVETSSRMTRSLARVRPEARLIRVAVPVAEGPPAALDEVLCHEAAHIVAHSQAKSHASRDVPSRAPGRAQGRAQDQEQSSGPSRGQGRIRPHGPEWAALMEAAGYPPRARVDPQLLGIEMPKGNSRARRQKRKRYVYDHRCPVCHNHRTSGRVVHHWRCAPCVDAGMKGELVVTRLAQSLARRVFGGKR